MSDEEKCKTCKFFSPYIKGNVAGRCRRHPPAIAHEIDFSYETGRYELYYQWRSPEVYEEDLCGEWRSK